MTNTQWPDWIRLVRFTCLLSFLASIVCGERTSAADSGAIPEIPYTKFVLDNGLTVIVHEDRKAPIVAVNLWYHVGSKNEPDGRSGFAHLFEHLMFNGSEHFDDDYFQALERVGATDLNGTTDRDRTNYFQNVPTSALDLALWMESDRMGHLLGAINQAKLDEQRGVVQNEKRQGENQPYGKVFNLITDATWPAGHPYAHTVIGSMEDLNAASVDDVHDWFKTWYGPNNAVISIAGDITPEKARERVEHFFGAIPPGPPIVQPKSWVVRRSGEQREVLQDRVPQSRVYKVWNIPEIHSREADLLTLAAEILSKGKSSRFYKRLVYEDQIATAVEAYVYSGEIAGQWIIEATARPGEDLNRVEAAIDEELARFLEDGPTDTELKRAKTGLRADFIRGIERIGGFGGKSDILASSEVYGGSPDAYRVAMNALMDASDDDVRDAARDWLADGVYVLEVHPFPDLRAGSETADRSGIPATASPPDPQFPDVQRARLKNGMTIVLAERGAVPLIDFTLLLDAGSSSDQFSAPGTASLAMDMLDEGTEDMDALEISDALAALGAQLGSGSNLDMSSVSLSTLKSNVERALDLYADVILEPAFPEAELERLRRQQIARIRREQASPVQMALRLFPKLLYGDDHAYGLPFTGSGNIEAVEGITRDDLVDFHRTWFKPNHATLIVVGDIRMSELMELLEDRFEDWEPGEVPVKNIARVPNPPRQQVYLIDRPGSEQSIIFAGHLALPTANPNEIAIQTMNTILGGSFTSRINMNLREDKGWAYGAQSLLIGARGQRPFIAFAPVQTDKTSESIQEIAGEIRGILTNHPPTADEVEKAQKNQILTLPGRWETIDAVGRSIGEIVRFDLPEDYYETYASNVRALDIEKVEAAAAQVLRPESMVWVVVGDRQKIESRIQSLNLGPIRHVDSEGNPAVD